ncbi:MAG: alpha/beta fold hydrolase [Pseudomonadota bacterium]
MRFLRAILGGLLLVAPAAHGCGQEGAACETPLGSYRIILPGEAPPEGGYPALLFFHGAGGSGARTLSNGAMVDAFTAAGFAVIGPDGLQRPNSRFGPGWSFHPERPRQRDEAEFTAEVIADTAEKHGVNPERVLLSGFSIGGSLVWYLACANPGLAAAYAPVAGAFWRPHPEPESCAGPVRMLHTHGWRDRVVPLEGRPLGGGRIYQGDVFYSMMLMRQENACDGMRADEFVTQGVFWRRSWTTCAPGTALEFALHQGGHAVPEGWSELAIAWFEGLESTSE